MIWQALGIAVVGVVAVSMLRSIKPEYALFAGLATGAVIVMLIASEVSESISVFGESVSSTKASNGIFTEVVKVIGIGYITEYGASLCKDYGSESIGKKVQLAGKVSIFTLAVPIVSDVINAIKAIIN